MIFKKSKSSLFSDVDDTRVPVYDFRRRTNLLFENYRAMEYKFKPEYNLNLMKEKDVNDIKELFIKQAVDGGNVDCLVEAMIRPVMEGIYYLDDQYLSHMDFYTRQGRRMAEDAIDIGKVMEFWTRKKEKIISEHNNTLKLWNKYYHTDLEKKEDTEK